MSTTAITPAGRGGNDSQTSKKPEAASPPVIAIHTANPSATSRVRRVATASESPASRPARCTPTNTIATQTSVSRMKPEAIAVQAGEGSIGQAFR